MAAKITVLPSGEIVKALPVIAGVVIVTLVAVRLMIIAPLSLPSTSSVPCGLMSMELGTLGIVRAVPTLLPVVAMGTTEFPLVLATYTAVEVVPGTLVIYGVVPETGYRLGLHEGGVQETTTALVPGAVPTTVVPAVTDAGCELLKVKERPLNAVPFLSVAPMFSATPAPTPSEAAVLPLVSWTVTLCTGQVLNITGELTVLATLAVIAAWPGWAPQTTHWDGELHAPPVAHVFEHAAPVSGVATADGDTVHVNGPT